jgi:hypothetical protein
MKGWPKCTRCGEHAHGRAGGEQLCLTCGHARRRQLQLPAVSDGPGDHIFSGAVGVWRRVIGEAGDDE